LAATRAPVPPRTWLTVAFGLLAKTPAGANSLALIPAFLPFLSSAFIPASSMSGGVRWFAEHEPFTPITDTLRGLLTGTRSAAARPLPSPGARASH
jgi:ABC-2 type transport system permease protein